MQTSPTARAAKPFAKAALACAVAALIAGCAVQPQPFTAAEQSAQVAQDRQAMFADQEPVTKPITLSEAMARAIKYNLDNRLKLMEEAVAQHQLDLSRYDLLPRLTLAAGYSDRDNVLGSSSRDVVTGTESLVPSTSSDKAMTTADLGFAWNILDFGVSYYQAQEQADRTLIMKERRRKVVHSLMQQVRQAYWLAYGAQEIEGRIQAMQADVTGALDDLGKIQSEKLRSPSEVLGERRQLLDTRRQLEVIRDELAQARPHLAALMDLDPSQPFTLAAQDDMTEPTLTMDAGRMAEAALLNRPEIVEARYNERISVTETRKAMAKLMPGLEIDFGEHYDSNSFLVNNHWGDVGLRVSWNIFNLLSAKQITATAQAQVDVARMQRMALNMAVLSQVYIARRDYEGRDRQFKLARELADVDHQILDQARNQARSDAQGKLAQIRASLNSLYSDLRVRQDYGALQNAYGNVLASMGTDPLPDAVGGHDVASLAQAVAAGEHAGH